MLIEWCESLPEYRDRGYHFVIHKTGPQSIAITLVKNEPDARRPRRVGERVVDLWRIATGVLHEVENPQAVSQGRFQAFIERMNGTSDYVDHDNLFHEEPQQLNSEQHSTRSTSTISPSSNDPPGSPTPRVNPLPLEEPPPERIYSCGAAIVEYEEDPIEISKSDDEHGNDKEIKTLPPSGDPTTTLYPTNPKRIESEGEPNREIEKSFKMSFPVPRRVWYPPECDEPSNGVLAATELVHCARYDGLDDDEFYADGATLAYTNETGDTTYLRGSAAI